MVVVYFIRGFLSRSGHMLRKRQRLLSHTRYQGINSSFDKRENKAFRRHKIFNVFVIIFLYDSAIF